MAPRSSAAVSRPTGGSGSRHEACFETPLGLIRAHEAGGSILRIEVLPAATNVTELVTEEGTPSSGSDESAPPAGNVLAVLQTQLDEYASRRRRSFDVPYNLTGVSPFARDVLQALATVQFGEVVTYGDLASMAGHPGAARAVGGVMRSNPLPLLIPCHRVVGASGIGGFALGLDLKRRLLGIEGVEAA